MVKKFFNALKSLGAFGLILIVCVGLIVASTLAFLSVWADTGEIYSQSMKLTLLEDKASYYAVNQVIEENYYVYTEGEYGEESLQFFAEARAEIDAALAELQDEETFTLSDREMALVADISEAQQAYQEAFEAIKRAFASNQTLEEIESLQADTKLQADTLRNALRALIYEAETSRQTALQTLAANLQSAIRTGVISLILLPFLAIWAFGLASRITQPVLTLTHAATAIAGDHFRPEILDELHDRRDGLGRLAKALEMLGNTAEAHEAALEAEIADLREQLHETRHRKSALTFPTRDAECV